MIVVVFICNEAVPWPWQYEDRILLFHKKYCGPDKKAALVAINVNVIPEDLLPQMQERAKFKGFAFAYLFDKTQKIAKDFDARYTPEFFVFGKDRKLVYKGAMDNTSIEKNVKENYPRSGRRSGIEGGTAGSGTNERPRRGIRYLRKRPKD